MRLYSYPQKKEGYMNALMIALLFIYCGGIIFFAYSRIFKDL